MHWACRRLHNVQLSPQLRLAVYGYRLSWSNQWSPCARRTFRADVPAYSSSALPILPATNPDKASAGDYKASQNLLSMLVDPQQDPRKPIVLTSIMRREISPLFQHMQDGLVPEKFVRNRWPGANDFWADVLSKALLSDAIMPDVLDFAVWWESTHGVEWPKFYETVMSFYLANEMPDKAMMWHARIMRSSLRPDHDALADVLNSFCTNPDTSVQAVLQYVYVEGKQDAMYDLVVPFLYGRGMSRLAMAWHKLFCLRGDKPTTTASRAFLVFLEAYHPVAFADSMKEGAPRLDMTKSADAQLGGEPDEEIPFDTDDLEDRAQESRSSQKLSTKTKGKDKPPLIRPSPEAVNRKYGEMFGIGPKDYNDELGARFLASTWVSFETAFSVLHGIGIEEIGPLSVQSIGVREQTTHAVKLRLAQLSRLGIGIAKCNYTILFITLVHAHNKLGLSLLLKSDMHPDSFEDLNVLSTVKASCVETGDERGAKFWSVAREIIAQRLSNRLIRELYGVDYRKTLDALDDLTASNLTLRTHTRVTLIDSMFRALPLHRASAPPDRSFFVYHIDLFLKLLSMGAPLPSSLWQKLFLSLGHHGYLDELEDLIIAIVQHVSDLTTTKPGFMAVEAIDIPQLSIQAQDLGGARFRVPNDLPMAHEWHPLTRFLNANIQSQLLRWGLQQPLLTPQPFKKDMFKTSNKPKDFFIARGVRLLRLLQDKGVKVLPASGITKRVILRLADLYGPELAQSNVNVVTARSNNPLPLDAFMKLCNEAWGSQLLPKGDKLVEAIFTQIRHNERSSGVLKKQRSVESDGTDKLARFRQNQSSGGVVRKQNSGTGKSARSATRHRPQYVSF